jgi:tetratricopeptide (TPR) repeat protein
LVIALSSIEERDEWIAQIAAQVALLKTAQDSASQTGISHQAAANAAAEIIHFAKSNGSAHGQTQKTAGLTCLGITIIRDSKLTRLQANQPCIIANSSSSQGDTDSFLNAIVASSNEPLKRPLIDNVFPEEFIAKYYQSLRKRKASGKLDEESMRSELHMCRVLDAFHDTVLKYVRIIVDEYHRKVPANASALYEFGPIKISLLPGYNQNDETIIEYTNAVNRHELHAIRWINSTKAANINTMLVTCVEYKGFRFSAYLDVPLGANTCLLDLCPQEQQQPIILKDEHLEELNRIGAALNLAANPHVRLQDQRTIALALHPSVELHHLPRTITGYPKGPYILNLSQILPSWPVKPDSVLLSSGQHRFRPEFLAVYPGQLMAADYASEKNLAAFRFLVDEHVPAVVERLEAGEDMATDSHEWTELLHANGLNCVLLGRLARCARLPHIKEHLLVEMVARTTKRAVQAQLRGSILHFKEVQAMRVDEELRAIVLHTLATILGNTPAAMMGYVLELLEATKYKFDYSSLDLESFRRLPRQALFLAIQHHCGLQFVDRVYDFSLESPFAKEDFLMFVPTLDQGPMARSFPFSTSFSSTFRKDQEPDELTALFLLGIEVLPFGEASWQPASQRALIAKQFVQLSRAVAQGSRSADSQRYLDLARSAAPRVHVVRAFIELEALEQQIAALRQSKATAQAINRELPALKALHSGIVAEVEAHLGPHHPVLVAIHQRVAELWASLASAQVPRPLVDSLEAHQLALAVATKALGRIHHATREQVLKIASINRSLERYDEALSFYLDAFKSSQQCGAEATHLGSIVLSIASCHQDKGNLDEALEHARRARSILEADAVDASSAKQETLDRAYVMVAELAQKTFEDVHEEATTVLSDDIQMHLGLAAECYERLFDGIRQKTDIDGNKLAAILKKIVTLKLRLARPSQKILIRAIKAKRANLATSQAAVSECMMRIVAAPSACSYLDRALERLEKPSIASAIGGSSAMAAAISTGEAKEIFEEFISLLQIVDS